MSTLDTLRTYSKIVADTADLAAMLPYNPTDATTNPSLILQKIESEEGSDLLEQARRFPTLEEQVNFLLVHLGSHIAKTINGRISTEVNARYSFDTEASVNQARTLSALYRKAGIPAEQVLIKLAGTWEGIAAAQQLEKENIHCNITLVFHPIQMLACHYAHVTLISPFVGRLSEWAQKNAPQATDAGVDSVHTMLDLKQELDSPLQIMAASFRTTAQICSVAGCDFITIAPKLLEALTKSNLSISPYQPKPTTCTTADPSQQTFLWQMHQDCAADTLLGDGIRRFAQDQATLEKLLSRA